MQNSQQFSQEFLSSIKVIDNVPCFVKINDSKFILVAIHEHLGLVQNFTQIVTNLVQNYTSIIIPDLFCNIEMENIDESDEFACIKQVNMNDVHLILKKCISYSQLKNKSVILLGFSTGAALGLKLIESFDEVSLGMFFYGYPVAKSLNPKEINCPIVIVHAEKDKVKHLSDNEQFKTILTAYQQQPHIQIQNINSSHGFMNHEHPNYDQKSFKYCRKILHQYLLEIGKNPENFKSKEKAQEKQKKQQQGGCSTY